MHMIQVIRSKNLFVIHEYLPGGCVPGIAHELSELGYELRRALLPHTFQLVTVWASDGDVCRASRVPDVKPSNVRKAA